MHFQQFEISGLIEITPLRLSDERGYFSEIHRPATFCEHTGQKDFVQENESLSARAGTIRGLHFQTAPFAQGKLVRCTAGAIFDVGVDLRVGSPTFQRWAAIELSPAKGNQLWVPPGFAHGFCTLEPNTVVNYKVSAAYSQPHDKGLAWDDPTLAITWPDVADPDMLSTKDRAHPRLANLPAYFRLKD